MDNKKLQKLEVLTSCLVKHTNIDTNKLCQDLDVSKDYLNSLVSELKSMGLGLLDNQNQIKLTHPIDEINLGIIEKNINSDKTNQKVHYTFATESTNQLAQQSKLNAVYITNYQTQGKGRQAKKWITPIGQSIALSVTHNFNFGLQNTSGLNIAIGVAIIQTLKHYGSQNIGLKWPNDVIGSKGKVAGILIEATGNTQSCRVIIGVGINWNIRQEIFERIDQPCSNAGISKVSRSEFIAQLILNINNSINEFKNNKLNNLRCIWQENDVLVNKKINLIQPNGVTSAIYNGINEEGLLIVQIKNELKTIASGEVSIRVSK
jgi:BirA family biotin operon repressor/biotin-[acetyl-CoA-carboxylase] ligase